MPTQLVGTQPGLDDLADLDALAEELNRLGFPPVRLTPPGQPPYVDTGLPQGMAPGERVHAVGMFFRPTAQPIAPAAAAVIIARTLISSQQG